MSHNHVAHWAQTALWTAAAVALFVAAFVLRRSLATRYAGSGRRILRSVYSRRRPDRCPARNRLRRDAVLGSGGTVVSVALIVTFTAVPFLFLAGLLGTTMARGAGLGTIFSGARAGEPGRSTGRRLRQALRDDTAQVAYWYEGRPALRRRRRQPLRTSTRYARSRRHAARLCGRAGRRHRPRCSAALGAGAARWDRERSANRPERDKLLVEVRARAQRYFALLQAMPDLMFLISRKVRISPTTRRIHAISSSTTSSAKRSGTACHKTSPTAC